MIITHFNIERIVSVSVAGMKQRRHLGKYAIILKISAIAVFSKNEVCNHNCDQDNFGIYIYICVYIYERGRAVKNKMKLRYLSTEGET